MSDGRPDRTDTMNPLVWAYLGDAVYDLFVRERVAARFPGASVHVLHKRAVAYVNCRAQAAAVRAMGDTFTEEEKDIVRRGRNAHSGTIPKNADMAEYKMATGFEALVGYLRLKGRAERLAEVLETAAAAAEAETAKKE